MTDNQLPAPDTLTYPLELSTWAPVELELEATAGAPARRLRFEIRTLTLAERGPFQDGYRQTFDPPWRAMLSRDADRPDELAKDDEGRFRMSAEEIATRRIHELADQEDGIQKFRRQQLDAEELRAARIADAVSAFVRVADGQQIALDGQPVKTGAQVVAAFAKYPAVLLELYRAIRRVNWLEDDRKKASSSRSGSSDGSTASPSGRPGATPGPIADDAASSGSVASATVPSSSEGTTPRSSGDPVH